MSHREDLEKASVPINELHLYATQWVLKLFVLRCGFKKEYTNDKGQGIRQTVVFVDEEGTKIQTTLFNMMVEKWGSVFKPLHAYYISNGRINIPKLPLFSVNKNMEIVFTQNTKVDSCNNVFNIQQLSNGFIPLDLAEQNTDGTLFDVVGILVQVKSKVGEGRFLRREVIITNNWNDRKSITLWGDFVENEGEMLAGIQNQNPVVAFCDVKGSTYLAEFQMSTTYVSSILVDPKIDMAKELIQWYEIMKADKIDISLTASKQIQRAKEVKLIDILDCSNQNVPDGFCKFDARIDDFYTKDEPIWYAVCKKCTKTVNVIKGSANCDFCKTKEIDFEGRYRMKLGICADNKRIIVTLFDAARYLLGCSAKDYIFSTMHKEEDSIYHRNMLLSKGNMYTFLVKNSKEDRHKGLIVEEMHPIGHAGIPAPDQSGSIEPKKRNFEDVDCIEEPKAKKKEIGRSFT